MSSIYKICCCYFVTSVVISILVYIAVLSYIQSLAKIEDLESDLKEIFKEISDIQHNSLRLGSHGSRRIEPTCSNEDVKNMIKDQISPLRDELTETRRALDQLRCQSGLRKQDSTDLMRTDFALESLGGKIYSTKDERYSDSNFFLSLFGIGVLSNEPRHMLRPSMLPGNCYAFKGTTSEIIIKLMAKVFIDSVRIEHISDSISPDGSVTSAPKQFSVYGLDKPNDPQPFFFGSFAYDINLRQPAQVFNFAKLSSQSHQFVKFNFNSNNGNPVYTCIYRISVHGKLDPSNNLLPESVPRCSIPYS